MRLLPTILCILIGSSLGRAQDAKSPTLKELGSRPSNYSNAQLLAALQASTLDKTNQSSFNRVFEELSSRATASDLPALAQIFSTLPPDYYKGLTFIDLADSWLRLNTPAKIPAPLNLPAVSVDLPRADKYPEPLRAAAAAYFQTIAPFRKLTRTEEGTVPNRIGFQSHQTEYWTLASGLFFLDSKPLADSLLDYRWAGWCGTGSDRFHVPQSLALVIAFIREQRWVEAVGAALALPDGADPESARLILLAALPDPQKIITGGLVALDTKSENYWPSSNQITLLCFLLQLPGDDRVDTLIQLAELSPPDARASYLQAIGRLVEKAPSKRGSMLWSNRGDSLRSVRVIYLTAPAQLRALNFLSAQASKPLSIEAAKALVAIFEDKRRPETIPALRKLLDHPSSSVAEKAANALTAMGETATVPQKLGPVRYRITTNGQPYSHKKIAWTVKYGGTSSSTSSEVKTDADGIASVPRDYFLDSQYGPISGVGLRTAEMSDAADPWFGILLPPPPALDDVIPVETPLASQTIELQFPKPLKRFVGRNIEVVLWGEQSPSQQEMGFWSPAKFSVPFSKTITFPSLAPGKYRAEIHIAGASYWTGEFVVGKNASTQVVLSHASDITFRILPPEGLYPASFQPYLFQAGKEQSSYLAWDGKRTFLRSVPDGHYTLRFLSRKQMEEKGQSPPAHPDFDAFEIPLEIGPDSPAEIDLGEIRIPAK